MKRSRFNEEQNIAILKEQEAGMATAEVCCRHGISSATFYKWKSKFGGLADTSLSGARVARELTSLTGSRSTPNAVVSDNPVLSACLGRQSKGAPSSPAGRS